MKSGLAVCLPPLWACADDPTAPSESVSPFMTVTWRAPTITTSPGAYELGLESGRDGLLYVPTSYVADTPIPLFVALHGAGGRADNWTGLYDYCDDRGMALLAVDAREATWDRVRGNFGPDVAYLERALGHVFDRVNVAPERMALAGFSDGASYALSLGPANGNLFPFLIAFSPGFSNPPEGRVGSPRVFVSHGTGDTILPVGNSRDVIVPTFRADGYDVQYVEFDGGHVIPADVGEQALDWFLA